MRIPAIAGALPFAHLLGRPAGARAEKDDDQTERDAENDNLDNEDGDGDDEKKDDAKKARGKRAEGDSTESENSEEDQRDDEKKDDAKKARGKRARADDDGDDGESDDDEGDDDSDGADMTKKGSRSTRLRERARCAAIFKDKAAGSNPALAATLAFSTDLPRSQAIAVLKAGGVQSGRRASLDERMSAVKTPNPGAGAPARGAVSTADQIIAAGKRRRGEA